MKHLNTIFNLKFMEILMFFVEVSSFLISGFAFANEDYIAFVIFLGFGFLVAFLVGDVIQRRERSKLDAN